MKRDRHAGQRRHCLSWKAGSSSQCLLSLTLQHHGKFEIILVADKPGLGRATDLPIKKVAFDEPNISIARNLGIKEAAGEIIAFIDDDSIAEPTWLYRLTAPFTDPTVIAATGWTRDRDGFRWQSRGARMTAAGFPVELNIPADRTTLLSPKNGHPVNLHGTNCAFRARNLREIGGFDPIFAYHLDESDVAMRLAVNWPSSLTAVVPDAQVIHARAAADYRDQSSIPTDLTATGRSAALFSRRHSGPDPNDKIVKRTRRKLIRHMLSGQLDPTRVNGIINTLKAGLRSGHAVGLPDPPAAIQIDLTEFLPMPSKARDHRVFSGWHWQAKQLRANAAKVVGHGALATVILLTPGFMPHRLRLTKGGWFEQTGGLWGVSEADDKATRPWQQNERLQRERSLSEIRRNRSNMSNV
ncbi:glycosyltransferase family 2 protein [Paracoccus albus]|uniref:glycosyltransferase family 2 protein n=1 Tax=Paracoccus albus TaxID=3017784 RepID=UPI0022F024DF|nr:glycosyltransferase [Paracoccus albus]WBU60222.1 glycosyltransferase [Paracoccus albus]